MKTKIKTRLLYLLAFFIPVIIFTLVLVLKSITPFGNQTLLNGDMLVQYVPFYTELSERLRSGNSLLYSWNRGMGIDYISEGAYYLFSPLNILLIFFTNKTIPIAISLLLVLKCGFAGLNMFTYLKNHFLSDNNISKYHGTLFITFSACYALCSYMTNYYTNIIWIDCFVMFPLIILSLERLVNGEKPFLYSIYLFIAIISNYYIGYMICIFCVLYFAYLIFINHHKGMFKVSSLCVLRFAEYSLIAGALCAFVLIPTIFSLTSTDAAGLNFYDSIDTYYPMVITFFRQMMSANPTYWHHPYLYCTDLVFLLVPVYFFNRTISLKERIGKFILYLIMILSFQLNILDFIWNGFHRVNCFAGRQSFIFIFLVIVLCTEVMFHHSYKNSKLIIFSYIITLCAFLYINTYFDFSSTFKCVLKNTLILSVYLIIFKTMSSKTIFSTIIMFTIMLELFVSTFERISIGTPLNEYKSEISETESALNLIDDDSFYRIKNCNTRFKNEGALCNYYAISTYSSMANTNLSDFLYKIGFPVCLNAFGNTVQEPVFRNIFCEKYILSSYDYLKTDSLRLVGSTDSSYVYQNTDSLAIAFEVSDSIIDFKPFDNDNPFEVINSFANSVSDCGLIYEKADTATDKNKNLIISADSGRDLFLYSKPILSNSTFVSPSISEALYTDNKTGIMLLRPRYSDNYIYYVAASPYGGYITLPDDAKSDDIVAYTLNKPNYRKLMSDLSENQMNINQFDDGHVYGHITASFDGTILTSIPYSEGWSVKIDGKKIRTFDIENALLAFHISEGEHTIEFSYLPKGLIAGMIISITALLILITDIVQHLCRCKSINSKTPQHFISALFFF